MLRFDEQALSIFQEDEKERSTAFMNYTNSGMPPSVAAQILGIKLPEGVEFGDLDAAAAEMQALAQERLQVQRQRPAPAAEDKALDDLRRWERRTVRLQSENKSIMPVPFVSKHIDPVLSAAIEGSLESCTTQDEIRRVFDNAKTWRNYP